MNKKITVLMIGAAMLLTMISCGNKTDPTAVTVKATEVSSEVEETSAPEIATETEETIDYSLPEGEEVVSVDEMKAEGIINKQEFDAEMTDDKEENNTDESEIKDSTVSEIPYQDQGCGCEYEAYLALSGEEQQEYMNTFATPMDFIEWCKAKQAEHESHDTSIIASGGDLDLSDFIK